MGVGVNIVWSPLTRPLSHQGRGDNGVIFYVILNSNDPIPKRHEFLLFKISYFAHFGIVSKFGFRASNFNFQVMPRMRRPMAIFWISFVPS
jgi:hypothetical protein